MNAQKHESLAMGRINDLELLLEKYQSQIQEWEQQLRRMELEKGTV
jgi:hypothetical protein